MVLFPRVVLPLGRLVSRSTAWGTGLRPVPTVRPVLGAVQRFCTAEKTKSAVAETTEEPAKGVAGASKRTASMPGFTPGPWEKRMLVMTGRYPSTESIPYEISYDELTGAKDKMRVYTATFLTLLTILAAMGVAIWGRSERDKGDSLTKRNIRRREQYRKEQEEAAAAAAEAK